MLINNDILYLCMKMLDGASLIYSHPSVLAPRVCRFPVFEKSFCEELVEELEHFEQSPAPKGRPNTMNHYGVIHFYWLKALKSPFNHCSVIYVSLSVIYCALTFGSLAHHALIGNDICATLYSRRVHTWTVMGFLGKSGWFFSQDGALQQKP